MVLFTVLQLLGLAVLWIVKEIPAIALSFPFFVVLMIPYRMLLGKIFTAEELEMLDGSQVNIVLHVEPQNSNPLCCVQAGKNLSGEKEDNEDEDFYRAAYSHPITPATVAPLHQAMMSMIHSTQILNINNTVKPEQP